MRKLRALPLCLGAMLLASVAVAGEGRAPERAPSSDPKITFEKYMLPNGLEVILHQDNRVPLVFVSVWYHVGSGDEVPGRSGFAHLFEHMMFQGTKHTGEDSHFRILEESGQSEVNGTTTTDRTNYYEEIPSNALEIALWLESDRMGYMLPGVTQKSLDNQREVVRNERRQRYDNVPYGRERFVVNELLYDEGHPYRYLVIGRHEDLEAASLDDVKAFFKKWYVPSNATLCIAGDFDTAEAKRLVEKWFGSFPASEKPKRRTLPPTPITKTKRKVIEDDFAQLRRVHYAWHTPAMFQPGDAELDILANALGDAGTGRLYRVLVLEKQLARSVSVYQGSAQMSSAFHVIVELKDDADLAEVEKIIDQELQKVIAEPISEREFKRAVIGIESAYIWGLESLEARAETLQSYNHYVGNPDYITQDLDRYRTTTPANVQATAAKYLQKQNRVEVFTMPAKKGGK